MPILKPCIVCRRPTNGTRCKACQKIKDDERNANSFYQSQAWRNVRSKAKAAYGDRCYLCNSSDRVTFHHLIARDAAGPDTVENLRPLCASCHSKYEADKRAGKTTELTRLVEALAMRAPCTLLAIVGPPAAGKTYVRELLARELGLPTFAIDDYRDEAGDFEGSWTLMLSAIAKHESLCIIESSIVPPTYRHVLEERHAVVVLCQAAKPTRERRLKRRARRGDIDWGTYYSMLERDAPHVDAHIGFDTTNGSKGRDHKLVAAVRARVF